MPNKLADAARYYFLCLSSINQRYTSTLAYGWTIRGLCIKNGSYSTLVYRMIAKIRGQCVPHGD